MIYSKKYVVIPVSFSAEIKRIYFYKNGERFFYLDAKITEGEPDFVSYATLPCDMGSEIECIANGKQVTLGQSDTMDLDGLYDEPLRPKAHFTVANGWNNDPNGMIKFGDTYHMFYQYNPCEPSWGNMHWGHATSSDMLSWKETDVALYPDAFGTMYSGSAVEKDGKMFLFYTAAGDHSYLDTKPPFTQCLAISEDGGKTFNKYVNNPIIENIGIGNRDPKVVYSKSLGCYLMALYLDEGAFPRSFGYYAFFTSDDLYSWKMIQRFEIPNDFECPDILIYEKDSKEYYAIMGAAGNYIIGEFVNRLFKVISKPSSIFPKCIDYAGQSFSGMGGRHVRIGWQRINVDGRRFSQQMGIPIELSLVGEGADMHLVTAPVKEIEGLAAETLTFSSLMPEEEISLTRDAYDITLECEGALTLSVFGKELVLQKGSARIIADICSVELWNNEFYTVIGHVMKNEEIKHVSGAKASNIKISKLSDIHK